MIALLKTWRARRKLQRIVEERRKSFEVQQFRRRRFAALKHYRPEAAR